MSGVQLVTGPASDPPLSRGGLQSKSVAMCPTGKKAIGGGYQIDSGPYAADGIVVVTNGPTADGAGWQFVAVQFRRDLAQDGYQFFAKAICAYTD